MEKTINAAYHASAPVQNAHAPAQTLAGRAALRAEYNRRAMEASDKFDFLMDAESSKHRRLETTLRRRWAEAKENMLREREEEAQRHTARLEELRRERKRTQASIENERQEAFARLGMGTDAATAFTQQ